MRKQKRSEDVLRRGRPNPCPECPKYAKCVTPCDEVEQWISQDYIGRSGFEKLDQGGFHSPRAAYQDYVSGGGGHSKNEFLDQMRFVCGDQEYGRDSRTAREAWETLKALNITEKQMEFARMYYKMGMRLTEIAKRLKLSAQAIDERHKSLKKEIRDRLNRLKIWQEIRDEYEFDDDEEPTKRSLVVMLYFGALKSPGQIMSEYNIAQTTVSNAITEIKGRFS